MGFLIENFDSINQEPGTRKRLPHQKNFVLLFLHIIKLIRARISVYTDMNKNQLILGFKVKVFVFMGLKVKRGVSH